MNVKCELDIATRHQLKERIEKLGLSYQDVADFLGIGKSTLQRWINGNVKRCSPALLPRLNSFLSGKNTRELSLAAKKSTAANKPSKRQTTKVDEYNALLKKITDAYKLCCQHNCQNQFQEELNLFFDKLENEISKKL